MTQKELHIVPAHAIYLGGDTTLERNWLLESYQKNDGGHHIRCFMEHMKAAIDAIRDNPAAYGCVSGGLTRDGTQVTEAQSYLYLAKSEGWVNSDAMLDRVNLEGFARDSQENLLYSLAANWAAYRWRPGRVVVHGFAFKAERFRFHFASLDLGGIDFEYRGVNDPAQAQLAAALQAEQKTLDCFRIDPLGLGQLLYTKKETRNPRHQYASYSKYCGGWPELKELLKQIEATDRTKVPHETTHG